MLARTVARSVLLLVILGLWSPVARGGVDEGVARYVPWSGSYWPIREGALIHGPLAKYDRITGGQAASWERETNPPHADVPDWYGYCHAWAAAAVMDYEPARHRSVPAWDGTPVELGIGDQKGMLTACHTDDVAQHYGVRFDGQPEDDPQDIYPDQLWRVLRLYIQQRGVPIILDVEGGTQVWNFPVYAYRVVYRPEGRGNLYRAEMTLWMADDAVPPDIVGVQVHKQTYYFRFELRDGAAQLGTGRWIEPSVRDHPDFAWFPYVVRAENPQVEYERVREMLGFPSREATPSAGTTQPAAGTMGPAPGSPPGAAEPPSATDLPPGSTLPGTGPPASELPGTGSERPAAGSPGAIVPFNPEATALPLPDRPINPLVLNVPPNVLPGSIAGSPEGAGRLLPAFGAPASSPAAPDQPWLLSPMELLSLVVNQTSHFDLDITVDKFDGGHYDPGEALRVRGTAAREGHLYLFYLDSGGGLRLLYPQAGEPNRVRADRRFELPARESGRAFRVQGPPGVHRIKAVLTSRPLLFTGLVPAETGAPGTTGITSAPGTAGVGGELPVRGTEFRLPPSQSRMYRGQLLEHLRGGKLRRKSLEAVDPRQFLGDFAQDETAFYVRGALPATTP